MAVIYKDTVCYGMTLYTLADILEEHTAFVFRVKNNRVSGKSLFSLAQLTFLWNVGILL
jgi:hypothetical protein